jgi:hypothetical protein
MEAVHLWIMTMKFQTIGKDSDTFESMSHPPLVPYLMAAVINRGSIDELYCI